MPNTSRYTNPHFLSTGIPGLDEVLAGGFPAERLFLVEGEPGSGKTTLAMQFLLEGISKGETCMYISLSESKKELVSASHAHGWDIDRIHIYDMPVEDQVSPDSTNTFFHSSELELSAISQKMIEELKKIQPLRVVIDSLTELKLMAQDPMKFRRQVLAFKQFFLNSQSTVLLLDDRITGTNEDVHSVVHGIVKLEQLAPEYGAERRRLSVMKMRGVAYRGGYHDFLIRTGGLIVFPRLVASEHGIEPTSEFISCGIKGIDSLIGGGVDRGSSTLVLGPAGTGKSSLVMQYGIEAAKRGEHVAVFTFDEGIKTIITRSKGLGFDIQGYVKSGTMTLRQIDPAQLSPGEFVHLVRSEVDRLNAKVVIIDSLNGYLNAMPEERFLVIQMHELLSYLSQMGVATFMIVVQHGLLGGAMISSVDVSYLADNVFLLRYFELFGRVRQAISVLKKRSGPHERTIREMHFGPEGIEVGEPIKGFQGILSGTPFKADGGTSA